MYDIGRSLGAFGAGSLLRTPPIDSTSENSSPYDPIWLRTGSMRRRPSDASYSRVLLELILTTQFDTVNKSQKYFNRTV